MATPNGEGGVTFSVKELLAIQAKALERIEGKVDQASLQQAEALGKIDVRVTLLEQRPDLEPRIRSLEDSRTEESGARQWWDSFWARVVGVAAIAGAFWWLPSHF